MLDCLGEYRTATKRSPPCVFSMFNCECVTDFHLILLTFYAIVFVVPDCSISESFSRCDVLLLERVYSKKKGTPGEEKKKSFMNSLLAMRSSMVWIEINILIYYCINSLSVSNLV